MFICADPSVIRQTPWYYRISSEKALQYLSMYIRISSESKSEILSGSIQMSSEPKSKICESTDVDEFLVWDGFSDSSFSAQKKEEIFVSSSYLFNKRFIKSAVKA